jgi:hypothetical protein
MTRFDHKDFAANPAKYRLFRTARIASHIFTENGEHDLAEGTIVGITYRFDAYNAMYRRTEPVYTLTGMSPHRDLYANALSNFVL